MQQRWNDPASEEEIAGMLTADWRTFNEAELRTALEWHVFVEVRMQGGRYYTNASILSPRLRMPPIMNAS